MTEHLIKPGHISRIDICYNNNGVNLLTGLRLCDKDNNTLLQCGNFNYTTHTMVINEDERLVGVRSKTWKDGNIGCHCDIEFLVCKYK